jgi:flavin-dependent dehydrogenase
LKSQGYQVKHGAVILKDDKRCEFEFSEQFTKGFEWTWQIPGAHFDNILAEEVEKMGVPIDFETSVSDIEFDGSNSTVTVINVDGTKKQINAKFVIDSSGYGRVLPRLLGLDAPSDLPPRKTLFAHFKDENRPDDKDANRIVVVSHSPDIWIWIIPFSNGNASVGFVGSSDFFQDCEGTLEEQLRLMLSHEPLTKERFANAKMEFEPKCIGGYSKSVKALYGDGFALTGNAAEFLDPVFSAGVTFATETGSMAAKLACRQLKGEKVNWQIEYVKPVFDGIDVFRTYINGWYDGTVQKIFFAEDPGENNKNMICSVLAGYVWDQNNPYVTKHKKRVETLAKVIEIQSS